MAAERMRAENPYIEVVLVDPASPGSMSDSAFRDDLQNRVELVNPNIIFLGLGAPKQEVFAHQYLTGPAAGTGVVLCVGAAIDFYAQVKRRAPRHIQILRLEWLYRALSEPRRLGRRYMSAALFLPSAVSATLRLRADLRGTTHPT